MKSIIVCKERGIFAGTYGPEEEPIFTSDERMAFQTVPVFPSREDARDVCDEILELDMEFGIFDIEVPEHLNRIGLPTLVANGMHDMVTIMLGGAMTPSTALH